MKLTKEEVLKKCAQCQTDISFKATKCPNCRSDQRSWVRKHPILSGVLFTIGLSVFLSALSDTSTTQEGTGSVNAQPSVNLTRQLKIAVSDPYWSTPSVATDYDSVDKILVKSVLFSTYANQVVKGEGSSVPEEVALAKELRQKLVKKQISEYPKMRKAQIAIVDKKVWENDIDVSVSGATNSVVTFVGTVFASNKGVKAVHVEVLEPLTQLRFKQANYKWRDSASEFDYYELETPDDSELVPVTLN